MKKVLLTTMGIAALGMVSYAATFMRVKTADGSIDRYAVEDVIEVDFDDEYLIPSDTTPVIPSDTLLSNHPYVDLGLPSGTLWATYNVGASKPEEYGDYFAWGETEPKEVYYENTNKWYNSESYTKYNSKDGLTTLLSEDDAATANWGKEWRMPTIEEQRELQENCYMVWTDDYNGTDVSGVIFYKAKSADDKREFVGDWDTPSSDYSVSSDAHVFIPAAANFWGRELFGVGQFGYYWSSSLREDDESCARDLGFDMKGVHWRYPSRIYGFPVRAVLAKKAARKKYIVKIYTSDSILIESQEVVEGTSVKEIQAPEKNGYEFVGWSSSFENVTSDLSVYALYKQIVPSDTLLSNHPYVDLGLPSGTLWATYNVGADRPEYYGYYFAWGETEEKDRYNWGTYKWSTYKWENYYMTKYNSEDGLTTLLSEDDAATANWGKEWRMPTNEEQRELSKYCYKVWTDEYKGRKVSGVIFYKAKNSGDKGDFVADWDTPSSDYNVFSDAHVFLPNPGGYIGENGIFICDRYWSSSLDESYEDDARNLGIYRDEVIYQLASDRCYGYPVRAVRAKK